mgnify:CR=1 FL=1
MRALLAAIIVFSFALPASAQQMVDSDKVDKTYLTVYPNDLAMITEVIFSWPGVGQWLINSIYQRDYPAISGGLLTVSLFVIIANIAADILHNLLDPVSRNQSHGKV